jgi:hypothetical protein
MAPDEPERPEDEAAAARDALRRLEERLNRASDAAERLMSEAAAKVKPPPAGWQAPEDDGGRSQNRDLELIVQVVQSLRELIPPDLERRLAEALRELLLAIRALIDWYLDRAERRRSAPAEVHDIPIQ